MITITLSKFILYCQNNSTDCLFCLFWVCGRNALQSIIPEKTSLFPPNKNLITLKISHPLLEKTFNSPGRTFNSLKKNSTPR